MSISGVLHGKIPVADSNNTNGAANAQFAHATGANQTEQAVRNTVANPAPMAVSDKEKLFGSSFNTEQALAGLSGLVDADMKRYAITSATA